MSGTVLSGLCLEPSTSEFGLFGLAIRSLAPMVNRLTIPGHLLYLSFLYLCNRLVAGSSDQTWSVRITGPTVVYQTVALHGLCAAIPLVYILVGNTLYSLDLISTWFGSPLGLSKPWASS